VFTSGMDRVNEVLINGEQANFAIRNEHSLTVRLPETVSAGLCSIELVGADSERFLMPDAVMVGQRTEIGLFRIGDVSVMCNYSAQLDEDTVALGGAVSINGNIRCEGLLLIDAGEIDLSAQDSTSVDLGRSGRIWGSARLYIPAAVYREEYDPEYSGDGNVYITGGRYEMQCNPGAAVIREISGEEAA